MKHHYTIWIIPVLLTSLIFTGCSDNRRNTEMISTEKKGNDTMLQGVIHINGETIEGYDVFESPTSVRLPFLKIVQALGMVVEEKEKGCIWVTNDNIIYVLDCSKNISFASQGTEDNLMIPVPGSSSYYCAYELNDVILDFETLDAVLYQMGVDIDISIDYKNYSVNIIKK